MLIEGVVSGWEMVRSGVPQGSVLGPVLFVVFIDDIDENIRSTVLKFADDTKVVAKGWNGEGQRGIEWGSGHLVSLFDWSQDCKMLFNLDKCVVMHFGFNNIGESMELGGNLLVSHTSERDLGVIVQSNLNVDMQCNKAACEANRMLGMIMKNFRFQSRSVTMPLYKSIVRPHLGDCVQAWRPHYGKDIDKLEKVQRRVTNMVEGLEGYSYSDRLWILDLTAYL